MEDIIKETFLQVEAMGIWNEDCKITMDDFAAYIAEQSACLTVMIGTGKDDVKLENLKLDDLLHVPFKDAKEVIMRLPLYKRIAILAELDTHKDYLYHSTTKYATGIPKEEQISAKTFRHLMTIISHLEILQGWLYGIE
jgi:hypothetical protein